MNNTDVKAGQRWKDDEGDEGIVVATWRRNEGELICWVKFDHLSEPLDQYIDETWQLIQDVPGTPQERLTTLLAAERKIEMLAQELADVYARHNPKATAQYWIDKQEAGQ